jgi:hypothetical protein
MLQREGRIADAVREIVGAVVVRDAFSHGAAVEKVYGAGRAGLVPGTGDVRSRRHTGYEPVTREDFRQNVLRGNEVENLPDVAGNEVFQSDCDLQPPRSIIGRIATVVVRMS